MPHSILCLLQTQLGATPTTLSSSFTVTQEQLERIYRISAEHDIAHLLYAPLRDYGLLPPDGALTAKFLNKQNLAFFRYIQISYTIDEICTQFERYGIDFIPLKGAVIRSYYPEPWMRTSCDIDILIHEEDLDRAISLLVHTMHYKKHERGYHDVSLYSESGVHLELHFSLISDMPSPEIAGILDEVWERSEPRPGCTYHRLIPDDLFYFYHILHMAHHFQNGGCGIRPFLDIWILNHRIPFDCDKRYALLERGGLLTFARQAEALSEVWLSGQAHTALTADMEQFIIKGGVYGSMTNKISVQQPQRRGKRGYILSRIFLSRESLCALYPGLRKHKWLLPVYQIRRWFRLLAGGRTRRSLNELKTNRLITEEQKKKTIELLERLEL